MFLQPMLLEGYEEPFDDNEYIFEPKIEGYRLIYSQVNQITHLYSRFHRDVTRFFPEIYHIHIDDDIVLDGVIANVDKHSGHIDSDCIKQRFSLRNHQEIQKQSIHNPCNYILFDILFYKGRDLRGLPLMKRREILRQLDLGNRNIGFIPFIENNGSKLFEEIRKRDMQGMVAKKKDSLYIGDRSDEWLKIMNWQYDDFFVTGYTSDSTKIRISAVDKARGFRETGFVSSGLTLVDKLTLLAASKPLILKESEDIVSLLPVIKARIKFQKYSKDGFLRDPSFVRFL